AARDVERPRDVVARRLPCCEHVDTELAVAQREGRADPVRSAAEGVDAPPREPARRVAGPARDERARRDDPEGHDPETLAIVARGVADLEVLPRAIRDVRPRLIVHD